jgi:hypothetical protein
MEEKTPILANEVSKARDSAFRKSVWLQIYLPLLVIILILAGGVAALWVTGSGTTSAWADISLVLLLIPALLLGLIVLAILIALVYAMLQVITLIPGPARQLHKVVEKIAGRSLQFTDLIVRPMILPQAGAAAVRQFWRTLFSIFRKETWEDRPRGDTNEEMK